MINWWGVFWQAEKKGGVLGEGQTRKKGVLGVGQVKKGEYLPWHIPMLNMCHNVCCKQIMT